ncbi:hypothetical protein B0H67DRAFT_591138 [Lasiosphaeris hirsuta]|uniref:Uncharacterized protein n=1 Tax=Lasiosphaeris hirsuta TaxID=260670 RepID=A0AA39ZVM0_9PEZI|nr:hypothetical protein B0H67DRAFT_591138 [Lasiosphaeris hirsuta]
MGERVGGGTAFQLGDQVEERRAKGSDLEGLLPTVRRSFSFRSRKPAITTPSTPLPQDTNMATVTKHDGPRILLRPVSPARPLWRRVLSTLECTLTPAEPLVFPLCPAGPTRVVVFLPFHLAANLDPRIEPYRLDSASETPRKSDVEIVAAVSPVVSQLAGELYSSVFASPESFTEKPLQLARVSPILTYHTETTDPTHIVLVLEHEMTEEEEDARVLVAFADGEADEEGCVAVSVWEGQGETWKKAWLARG